MISGKCDFIYLCYETYVCKQALKFYFIFCIVFQSLKTGGASCGFGNKVESFDENKNTFVNKSIQNRKMYIQK